MLSGVFMLMKNLLIFSLLVLAMLTGTCVIATATTKTATFQKCRVVLTTTTKSNITCPTCELFACKVIITIDDTTGDIDIVIGDASPGSGINVNSTPYQGMDADAVLSAVEADLSSEPGIPIL